MAGDPSAPAVFLFMNAIGISRSATVLSRPIRGAHHGTHVSSFVRQKSEANCAPYCAHITIHKFRQAKNYWNSAAFLSFRRMLRFRSGILSSRPVDKDLVHTPRNFLNIVGFAVRCWRKPTQAREMRRIADARDLAAFCKCDCLRSQHRFAPILREPPSPNHSGFRED